jgi:hypothetical protein
VGAIVRSQPIKAKKTGALLRMILLQKVSNSRKFNPALDYGVFKDALIKSSNEISPPVFLRT